MSLKQAEGYIHLDPIEWTPERLQRGVVVKLKEVPFYQVKIDLLRDYLRAELRNPRVPAFQLA